MTDEIQAGLDQAMNTDQFRELWRKWWPSFNAHREAAQALRNRIENGRRTIEGVRAGTLTGFNPDSIPAAEAQLTKLEQELREHDWGVILSLGMATSHAFAHMWGEARDEEGWALPGGSMIRVVIPGILNIAVELK